MKPTRFLSNLTLVTLLLQGTTSLAETIDEARQFQVEVIVFKQLSPETEETFTQPAEQEPEANRIALVDFNPLTEDQVQLLPTDSYVLAEEDKKVRRSRGYSVLSHFSWLTQLQEGQSLTYEIPGYTDSENDTELTGSITVALRRYLHTIPKVTISRWGAPEPTFLDNLFDELQVPGLTNDFSGQLSADSASHPGVSTEPSLNPMAPSEPDHPLRLKGLIPKEFYTIHQARRMRSGEVHYFDHPMFGLLIKIVPAQITPTGQDDIPLGDSSEPPASTQPSTTNQ
ncbi:CsiV family protein [Hahella ganghwensis]|uniref:CsiV family protein n=1 Tax=Hahella ganghwensis TaxID=286420 RepID=UPI000377F345|nr:CsiV family protein [Hahella ganghwensis]